MTENKISEFFTWEEVTNSSKAKELNLVNEVPIGALSNCIEAARTMDKVRLLLGAPIKVNSWYRSPKLNSIIGGAKTSQHLTGYAIDFVCPKFGTPYEICLKIQANGIKFDQLIYEGTWVHISFDPAFRGMKLTKKAGKSGYLIGIQEQR